MFTLRCHPGPSARLCRVLMVGPLMACTGGSGAAGTETQGGSSGSVTGVSTAGETVGEIASTGMMSDSGDGSSTGTTVATGVTATEGTTTETQGSSATVTTEATEGTSGSTTTTEGTTTEGTTTEGTTTEGTTTEGTFGSTTEDVCPEGSEGCPCLPGEVCEDELVCVNGACAMAGLSCGDGKLDPGETCDDGNELDYDGCTSSCDLTKVLDIDVAYYGGCVLLSGDAVRCWGGGLPSQLGYPSNKQGIGDDDLPGEFGPVVLGGPAVAVTAGGNHSCAIREGGDVLCWGRATDGQLGYGNTEQVGNDEDPADAGPVKINGVAISIHSSYHHSCTVLEGGDVRCWGFNSSGQLGLKHSKDVGDNEHPIAYPPVVLGESATAVAAGLNHSCALLASQQIRCWGDNGSGQVGVVGAAKIGISDHPGDHPPLAFTGVSAVSAGHRHSCAITTGGALRCWGDNDYGQTGHGNTYEIGKLKSPDTLPPVQVGGKVLQISSGNNHNCALLEGGDVRCWGRNNYGQLGLGHTTNIGDDEHPKDVPPIKLGAPAIKVVAGYYHSCALLEGGSVRCWGLNDSGQLGLGNTVQIGDDEHPEDVGLVQFF